VVALDAASRKLRWERRVGPKADFKDVDGLALDEGRLYAAAYSGVMVALEPATEKVIWEVKAPQACRVAAGKGFVVAITTEKVLAVIGKDGKELWNLPLQGTPGGIPVALGRGLGLILVPNSYGLLLIDGRGGKTLRNFTHGQGATATPTVAGKRLYAVSNAGELVAVELLK
jgi:outer membrane protein assembly factor BamB